APEGGLESPRGRREVSRRGGSYHVRVARGVQGYPIGDVIATSAEKGGVDEGGPRGIQLHDEGISLENKDVVGAAQGGLIGPGGGREVDGVGLSRHVGVARRVQSDPRGLIR